MIGRSLHRTAGADASRSAGILHRIGFKRSVGSTASSNVSTTTGTPGSSRHDSPPASGRRSIANAGWNSRQPACLRRLAWRRHPPPTRTRHGRHFRTCRPTSPKALKANPKAWTFFQELASSYRRHFVPPLPRKRDARRTLDLHAAECVARHIEAGGITRYLYGGNAFFYHITLADYSELLGWLSGFPLSRWAIPSVGPSFGRAMDQAPLLHR